MSGGGETKPPEVERGPGGTTTTGAGELPKTSSRHSTSPARSRALAAALRIGRAQVNARRLAVLGARCREFEAGLYNDERDPEPLLRGLAYRDVMRVALADPVVARVVALLPVSWRWADE